MVAAAEGHDDCNFEVRLETGTKDWGGWRTQGTLLRVETSAARLLEAMTDRGEAKMGARAFSPIALDASRGAAAVESRV